MIVDADTLAGWRRPSASLAQLREAVADLVHQEPETPVAVIADPSLKWALPSDEQDAIEDDIVARRLLFSPAGGIGGHLGFLSRVVERADHLGFAPVVVTDQIIPGVRVGRVRREGTRWVFDLAGRDITVADPDRPSYGRRRRSPRPEAPRADPVSQMRPAATAADSAAVTWSATSSSPADQKAGSSRSQPTMRPSSSGVFDPPAASSSR